MSDVSGIKDADVILLRQEIAELTLRLDKLNEMYAGSVYAAQRLMEENIKLKAEREEMMKQEPVLWVEADKSAVGESVRNVICGLAYSTAYSINKPVTLSNPCWPLYAHPPVPYRKKPVSCEITPAMEKAWDEATEGNTNCETASGNQVSSVFYEILQIAKEEGHG